MRKTEADRRGSSSLIYPGIKFSSHLAASHGLYIDL